MRNVGSVELRREWQGVQIPHGSTMTLPKGTTVDITQTLGGTYTVHATGGLFRIAGTDADALGIQSEPSVASRPAGSAPVAVDEQQIWDILRTCFDPEIPVNIVDLVLVYDLPFDDFPAGHPPFSFQLPPPPP